MGLGADDWPLIGRARQLGLVSDELRGTAGAGAGGIVIAGRPGVGKTRLAREALAAEAAAGVTTRWVTASAAVQALPLGAFADVLPPPFAATDPSPAGLLRRAADGLAAPADGPVVLGVDDAHLLDGLSAALLHHVARTGRVALVVTMRSGVVAPDAIVSLWKDDLFPRLDLEPLSRDETAELVGAVLGGPVDRPTLDGLWRSSEGNPLLLQELLHGGGRSQALALRNGVWTWHGPMSDDAGLRRMVTERVESVEPAVREVLELLALGEPLPIEALAELVAPEALDAAERAGLVSVALEGRRRQCRFAHPLYGDAVVASLTPEAVRARCAALASVLAREPGPEPADVVRLALLRLEAGEVVAAGRLEAAAGHASAALDHPLAEHLARAAVDAGGGTEARFLLANAVLWQGRLAEADHHLATLEAADLSDQHRVRVARQRAGLLFWSLDRAADAEGVLRRADALVTDERARLELVGLRSCFLAFQGVIGEAITAADRVMTSDAAEPSAVLWAAMGATLASGLVGWCDDAAISAARGRTVLAACPGDMSQLAAALADCECTALSLAGRVSDAASRAEEVVAWATAEANGMLAAAGATLRAQAELGRGDLASAAGLFREALAGLADFDPGGWRYHCHLGLAEAGAAQGDAAAARADLSAAEDLRPAARPVFRSKELLVECRVVAAAGDLRRAAAIATSSAGAAQELGLWATEALALHAALRLSSTAEATEVTDRLAALAGLVDNPLVAACAAHARALAAGDGPSLAEVGARFEHMELRLPAADAYAHAATAFAAAGEDRAALHAAAQARTLLRRCGAGPTPATARLPLAPSLTPREREIATLAGAGVSNKAIAARLDVSVRTVEGHLALAYAKLAVHRRDDLATALQSLA